MTLFTRAMLPFAYRGLRALAGSIVAAAAFALIGCSASPHEDVYSLASERSRIIAPALIAPGSGTEYAFTIESVPVIEIDCAITGATAFYSLDGGEYRAYAGPFALSVADPKVDQTITVTAYTTHAAYKPSEPVTQVYRFVATTVPAPAITPSAAGADYEFTIENLPAIGIACSLSGATTWYSVDGGEYRAYEGPFALTVANPKVGQTITVSAYSSHPDYLTSPTVTRVYRFVPTTVPAPVIASSIVPTSYHFYYHYDNLPTISATCALPSATIWYSLDNGATYKKYAGSFALPVSAGANSIETYPLTVYATAEGYIDSPVSSESYRFAKEGAIVTIAGTGTAGFAGDGGNARPALFNLPESVCVADDGTVYVSDTMNNRVRAINPDGTVDTIAGNGMNLYWTGSGPALNSSLAMPTSMALDRAKNVLYVVDRSNYRVMAITLDDGNIRRFTGVESGGSAADLTARLSAAIAPVALWFMPETSGGTLFIVEMHNIWVWEVDADIESDSLLTHVAGGGSDSPPADGSSAFSAQLGSTFGICADSGNLYVVAMGPGFIYRVDRASGNIYTLTSSLTGTGPWQPWIDGANLYFSETYTSRVRRFGTPSNILMAGSMTLSGVDPSTEVDGAMPGTASLTAPKGIFVVSHDGIFIADTGNNRIRKVILY